jgi:hypothetical protein
MRESGRASLQQANETIRFADVKAAAVLATAEVLAGQLPFAHSSWAKGVLLYTLAPRRQVTGASSQHYYDNVARRYGDDQEALVIAWLEAAADEDALERTVAGQIWAASMVAYRKFTQITWSIRVLVIGVVALAAVTPT